MKQYTSEKYIGRDKIIGLRRLQNLHRQQLHTHDFIEMVYIDDGSVCETIDGTDYRVKRGDLLFIHYGGQHSFFSEEGFSHTEIFFSPQLVEDGTITPESALALLSLTAFNEMRREQRGGMVSFSGEQRREVEYLLDAMLREQEANLASSQTVLSHYLSILLTKMLRQSEMAESESVMRDVWQDLRLYIDENAQKPLTLASLAARCFYNPSYFSRAFKQKFGVSPMEYVRHRRLEIARELLCGTDLSVEEIAVRAGFSDRGSFYHAFARAENCTPAEYRAKRK